MCAPAEKSSCASPAGRKSRKSSKRLMPSRPSVSIRLTPRRSIGITSITVCLSASSRDPTRAAGIRLGCTDRKFRHDEPLRNAGRHDHRRRRRDAHNGCQADAAFRVERVRKRAARAVEPVGKVAVTNLVVAMPPDPLATFLAERGYLPLGVPLIKRILALPGQSVCRNELAIIVDG